MRPLLFLTVRSTFNGVKRAVTSVRRLISLLFVLFYWFRLFMPSMMGPGPASYPMAGHQLATFPDPAVIQPVVFAVFGFLSMFLAMSIFSYRGSYKPADVDVLFPTPIDPRVVLSFRLVRDYLLTLLMPLFFALIGWRGASRGVNALFAHFPKDGAYTLRAGIVAWLITALVWVAIGYAASLFVNRTDLRSERNRLVLGVIVFGPMMLGLLWTVWQVRSAAVGAAPGGAWPAMLQSLRASGNSTILHALLPVPSGATAIAMSPLTGDFGTAILAGAGLIAVIGIALWVATTQVGWMYDQAAARGFDTVNLRTLRRSGDTYGILAEQARRGRVKQGRLTRRIGRLKARGAWALVWKDALLQVRSSFGQSVVLLLVTLFMVLMPLYGMAGREPAGQAPLFMVMLACGVYITVLASAQGAYIELLRRVDFMKPLPFKPSAVVFWEIVAKIVPVTMVVVITSIAAVAVSPAIWSTALASIFLLPSFGLILLAVVLLVTVLFPDFDDPSQRGFRGLMLLLGSVIVSAPGALLLVGSMVAGWGPWVAAIPVAPINLAITIGLATLAGNLYASYNPSE